MVRDTERTKAKLLDAARLEFVEHGLHGTTVERIAAQAQVNKERLYSYFGGKAALFRLVLDRELTAIAEAVPLEIDTLHDVARFAAATFDYQCEHPDLARLVAWEGLADHRDSLDDPDRSAFYQRKVGAIRDAQARGIITATPGAPHLLVMLMALSSWWASAPQLVRMMTGADSGVSGPERARRREAVAAAALRLAAPTPAQHLDAADGAAE